MKAVAHLKLDFVHIKKCTKSSKNEALPEIGGKSGCLPAYRRQHGASGRENNRQESHLTGIHCGHTSNKN